MVVVVMPSATIEGDDAVIVDVATLAAPEIKDTISLSVIVTPPTVPVTVEFPVVVEEVNVAV